ncbi:MAG: hypothetical protein V9E83_13010 [Baekduia sp.]
MSSPAVHTPSGRETALIAVGQAAIMVFGAALALLVAQLFGKSADTDAFLAAYGVYSLGLTFSQSFRLTAMSALVADPGDATITRLLGASVLIAFALAIPMVFGAPLVAAALVGDDPTGIATESLRVLWAAITGQLVASMASAVLTVRGSMRAVAFASMAVGAVSIGTFALLESGSGIRAAPIGLAIGSLWYAATLVLVLLRGGWRPRGASRALIRTIASEAGRLGFASAMFLSTTLLYVVCMGFATRRGTGEATLFAYAYVLMAILLGLTANVAGMAQSAAVIARDDRQDETAAAALATTRLTLVLAAPALAAVTSCGAPAVNWVLGSGFSEADVRDLLLTAVGLSGWLLASAVGVFAVVELLARHALRPLAAAAIVQATMIFPAAAAGSATGGILGIAIGLSAVSLAANGVLVRVAFGPERARAVLRGTAAGTGRELALVLVAFSLPVAAATLAGGGAWLLVAGAGSLALAAAGTRLAWPAEWRILRSAIR